MRTRLAKLATVFAVGTILLTGCVAKPNEESTHKAKTSGCLITSASELPGTPDRQLAADLVEAQVVYGLKVREVTISSGENLMPRLLKELQAGCVFMVASNPKYLDSLASFARLHPKMLVLFFGSQIAIEDQPTNFRWLADDISSAAKLAGFAASELSDSVTLYLQPKYWLVKEMEAGFRAGVKEYSRISGRSTAITVRKINTANELKAKLQEVVEPSVITLFASRSIWDGIEDYSNLTVIGSNLQLGKTLRKIDAKVVGSVERNSRLVVLRAVASLLARKFNTDPVYRIPNALEKGLVQYRTAEPASTELAEYRQRLISELNK